MQGDNIANSFNDVDEVNGGFAQGNGTFNIDNNGAFGGNIVSLSNDKRDSVYGDVVSAFLNGVGNSSALGNNGFFNGFPVTRDKRDTTYGGVGGSYNGAGDEIRNVCSSKSTSAYLD